MLKEARIKLTFWYLVIIMTVSVFFSVLIYRGATGELTRIERAEQFRDPILDDIRDRIAIRMFYLNLAILVFSGASGYFLAGQTLDPIRKNIEEQKEFVSNASHELRTPLTSLKTEIEVALRDPKTKDKTLLESNLEDVNRMQKLTNYLLKFNRYEDGREVQMIKVDLKEIVLSAVKSFKYKFDLSLKSSIVIGNKDSLVELVTILLDNAIKYSPKKGKVTVIVKDGTVSVKDRGVGISKVDIPHIFERFYRAGSPKGEGNVDGYGLGLSIAKSIINLHGGKIEVESKLGRGTTFTVAL